MKKLLQYLLFLSLTAVLLYFAFRGVSWHDMLDGVKEANAWWIGASMVIGYAAFLIRARRWQFIIHPLGYRPSFKHTYDAVMLTYLANFAMPRMGEVVRCGALRKSDKIPFESLLGTVVMERAFDLICLLVISVSVLFLRFDTFRAFWTNVQAEQGAPDVATPAGEYRLYIYVGAGLLVAMAGLFCVFRRRIRQWSLISKVKGLWRGLLDGLKAGFRLQRRGAFFMYTILLWVAYWLQAYTVMLAMPETLHLSAVDALFLMVVGGLGWVAPVNAGIGAYHFLIKCALLIYGIDNGVVFATISHETQSLMMIVFGLFSWVAVVVGRRPTTVEKAPTSSFN
ncbi:MAG: flippase-like domain-containing protein [Prevotellaceae bacterium]|jgi:uncharacterized membrane protein YbhN (UPF0104 family)|nr:flippase-like domain-containing protein [Prevotellaceae bacterium]